MLALTCALASVALAGCGSDAEVEKSTADVAETVRELQSAMKEETSAVKAGDARAETENVQLVAQVSHERLTKLAQRAPADTQDFADAAETWAKAVLTSRSAVLAGTDEATGAAAMLNLRLAAKEMDAEASRLHVTPWRRLDQY
ncbi:hypothetical protein HOK021_02220 [Streptomyces hygroscopicus]|nr:hypothetical protein HOK021_02220 [Streptomyces hygroscopicus]